MKSASPAADRAREGGLTSRPVLRIGPNAMQIGPSPCRPSGDLMRRGYHGAGLYLRATAAVQSDHRVVQAVNFADRTLSCATCGQPFRFPSREQAYFASKGFQDPKRCPPCRSAPRVEHAPRGRSEQEIRHGEFLGVPAPADARFRRSTPSGGSGQIAIPCSGCGTMTTLPFRPDGARPVYCSRCFRDRHRPAASGRAKRPVRWQPTD